MCMDPILREKLSTRILILYHIEPYTAYGMALMELIPKYSAHLTRIRILFLCWKEISQKWVELTEYSETPPWSCLIL